MPRLGGIRERHHQPYWDTLVRAAANTAPTPTVVATTRLFAAGVALGQLQWTNMVSAGQLPSDQSYIVLAMRVWFWMRGTNALTMYTLAAHQMYLTLVMGDKPRFAGALV